MYVNVHSLLVIANAVRIFYTFLSLICVASMGVAFIHKKYCMQENKNKNLAEICIITYNVQTDKHKVCITNVCMHL